MTTNLNKLQEEQVSDILSILAYQADITSQGYNYTGEKDWALTRIQNLIKQAQLIAYNLGVKDSVEALPEEVKITQEQIDMAFATEGFESGYNQYRKEVITNITKLIQ